jgi:aminoglycoside/choline kinase family phosphotransferase
MVEQMAATGRPAVGPPRQHQLWSLSVVLRCPSAEGDVYLKCSADIFRHEAVVTRALAERMPGLVPDVIAVDAAEGWMLMRDLGAPELGDQDESAWHEGVEALATVQRSWLRRTDELVALGLPVRSLTDLAAQVEAMTADSELMGPASPDLRARWRASAPALAESCRRLDQLGPGPTLVHGDFHPWNVVSANGTTRVFDWTDAGVSHPFVDLATYVFRTEDVAVRRRLLDSYLRAWSTEGSEKALREAASLALVVGALYQVQTYRALLPTLMGGGAFDEMAGAERDWMRRALTRHRSGLESPT